MFEGMLSSRIQIVVSSGDTAQPQLHLENRYTSSLSYLDVLTMYLVPKQIFSTQGLRRGWCR